ncbi:hypothetical protein [Pseudooceanicola sp.]|uniref:hypothetical protein n=1 Tax=Pseudooceanicola sp. TaxID=1914328 RepID=UPI0035C76502
MVIALAAFGPASAFAQEGSGTSQFEMPETFGDDDRSPRVDVLPRGTAVEDPLEPNETPARPLNPDPSLAMFDDRQSVIDSVRSKTAMPDDPLSHLQTKENVRILELSELEGADTYHLQTLDEVLQENRATIDEIRRQARANIFVVRAFEDEGYPVGKTLTWETAGTAIVTFVVDDRQSAAPEQDEG